MSFSNDPFQAGVNYQKNREAYAKKVRDSFNSKVDKWLFTSNEASNFTYDLTTLNISYLCSFVSVITQVDINQIESYVRELQEDQNLKNHVRQKIVGSQYRWISDSEALYGRRLAWYAFVRARKPNVVVETGIDKGLGSCVLASALMKNRSEGHSGLYYGVDINPQAGMLFSEPYSNYGQLIFSDAISFLKTFNSQIDIHINDSDHSEEYELQEYITIQNKLHPEALIIGDNSHCNDKLKQFAYNSKRQFLFFQEAPANHMYPGAGVGVAFRLPTSLGESVQPPSHSDQSLGGGQVVL